MIEPITAGHLIKGALTPKTHIKAFVFACIIGFWALIGYGVYKAYIKKPDSAQSQVTTIQKPEEVNIDQRQILIETEKDTFFFGVRLWRVKLGVSLLSKSKTQEQKGMIK